MPDNINTEEVAVVVRHRPETVRAWRYAGKGPKYFRVGRRVLYAREDVEAWLDEQRAAAGGERANAS